MTFKVQQEVFEGPLDLLLHLIKKNEVAITEISLAAITEQYLATLELMQTLNLNVAGEFLVMAATLIHIKSRTLLPPGDDGDDDAEEDSAGDLVQQLLEYQRFKEAARALESRELLRRDVFTREAAAEDREETVEFAAVSLFDLLSALRDVLARWPADTVHEVVLEKASVRDKMAFILDYLRRCGRAVFQSLFDEATSRLEVVVLFLAVLELVRIRALRVWQEVPTGPIELELAAAPFIPPEAPEETGMDRDGT
ncbi:MAG TPA: segregation/condensation protein A [Candidatus Acidoferrales bacterium]|nr:segregation/condensation protein A [Candidatus Acidoferrales bacterium]